MGNARRTTTGGDLRIATNLALPADYIAGGSLAILGKRGAGETFTSRVLAEELFAAKVHLVILDPMGVLSVDRTTSPRRGAGLLVWSDVAGRWVP